MKKIFAITAMISLMGMALWVYWEQEFKNYFIVDDMEMLALNTTVKLSHQVAQPTKPTFYHFFDQDCKNARINLDHISRMITPYQDRFNFVIVVQDEETISSLYSREGLPKNIEVILDSEYEITKSLQVKTTPYAAILDVDNTLYFRGNYQNANGLCGPADIKWSAPALALQTKNKHANLPLFQPYQLVARGCKIN